MDSLPTLIAASAATGLAGALFNPAVRAYLAHDAGPRRVEAFALFNVFYQAGILLGPLVGLALTSVDFRLTCLVAAGVFAVQTAVQVRALPPARAAREQGAETASVRAQWRHVASNRPFLRFSLAMVGAYVLSFQVYLALPLEVRRLAGDGDGATLGVALVFAASALVTIVGQTRVTAWCRRRMTSGRALTLGLALMEAAFLPLLAATALPAAGGWPTFALALAAPTGSAILLALGNTVAFPFEMDTIVTLAGGRLVATHYGLYNTISGIGITAGNLLTGAALDAARAAGAPALPWITLTGIGIGCAIALRALDRSWGPVPAAEQPSPG